MEAVNDYTWNTIAYSASIFYHFVFLQIVAIVSRNLFTIISINL